MNFSEKIEKLEQLTEEIQSPDISIEEAIAKAEEAMKLYKECKNILETFQHKITVLLEEENEVKEVEKNISDFINQ